jgi:membrane fusion protein, heavy metal efflux system
LSRVLVLWPGAYAWLFAGYRMVRSLRLLLLGGVAVLVVAAGYWQFIRADTGGPPPAAERRANSAGKKDGHGHSHGEEREGFVKLTAAQIAAAEIETAPASNGLILKEIIVPGRITINADRQSKIVPRLPGIVVKIHKKLGEGVAEGETIAVLESREIADAKAEYLASRRAEELAKTIYDRAASLWKDRITAEKDVIAARNAQQAAQIKLDLAHQRLHTMGLSEEEIEALPTTADETRFRFYEVRSPIAGRVTSRTLLLGQSVGTDKEIFTVAELSTVWIEMAIAPSDLTFAREGQEARVRSGNQDAVGKIVALSPVIDPDTRSAKAIAEIDNSAGTWRLGDFIEVQLKAGEQKAELVVPREAVQTIKGNKVVFVSEAGGFQARPITTGRQDSSRVEVLTGLEFGEPVAVRNTFTLKAELGKTEAEHEH